MSPHVGEVHGWKGCWKQGSQGTERSQGVECEVAKNDNKYNSRKKIVGTEMVHE